MSVVTRTHSRTPVDVKRLVGRPRRIGAKHANARSGQRRLGNLPVVQASAGLVRLGSPEFPFNFPKCRGWSMRRSSRSIE
jgi:hypothetical protein